MTNKTNMLKSLDILKITRQNLLKISSSLNVDQLNQIPENLNNNLIWNLGHVVVTQQLLCYKLSGLPCLVSDDMIERYRKGSRPGERVGEAEIEQIKSLMFSLIDRTKEDVKADLFKSYKTYTTSYNLTLESIDDALEFNNIHEGMHLGYCIALKKQL